MQIACCFVNDSMEALSGTCTTFVSSPHKRSALCPDGLSPQLLSTSSCRCCIEVHGSTYCKVVCHPQSAASGLLVLMGLTFSIELSQYCVCSTPSHCSSASGGLLLVCLCCLQSEATCTSPCHHLQCAAAGAILQRCAWMLACAGCWSWGMRLC